MRGLEGEGDKIREKVRVGRCEWEDIQCSSSAQLIPPFFLPMCFWPQQVVFGFLGSYHRPGKATPKCKKTLCACMLAGARTQLRRILDPLISQLSHAAMQAAQLDSHSHSGGGSRARSTSGTQHGGSQGSQGPHDMVSMPIGRSAMCVCPRSIVSLAGSPQ